MNIYDFDKTIYPKDSSVQFYFFNLRKKPILMRYWPSQFSAMLSHYVFKRISKTQMKTKFYAYFNGVSGIEKKAEQFWDKNQSKINEWYLEQRKEDDIIISASPEFLLKPICRRLNINLIASRVDSSTGATDGENCHGEEKVVRLFEKFPDAVVDEFYSDSVSDLPLAKLAKVSYFVEKREVKSWIIA